MNILTLIPTLLRLGSTVESAIATGLSLKNVTSIFSGNGELIGVFEALGEQLFPKLAPELRASAAVVTSYDPNYTKWVQNTLNRLVTPTPNLAVDGHYGPATRGAVEQLQSQLGLKVDGWVGDITSSAIQYALSKLDATSLQTPPPALPVAPPAPAVT